MTLAQQWWYLILSRNSFCILFPAKDILSCRQIISNHAYVRLKDTGYFARKALLNTGE